MTSRWPPPTIEGFISTPDHFLFAFERDQAIFAAMDRGAYHRSIFLDRRISAVSPQMASVHVDHLLKHVGDGPAPLAGNGWIFHIAHCGSTLLARALDHLDRSLVLREPLALRQLGVARAQSASGEREKEWRSRLRLTVRLAGRRYRPEAPVVVKANVPVNFIVPDLMEMAPSPTIFLYVPLRAYLLAILRSADHRGWVMNITTQLQPVLTRLVGHIEEAEISERAAALWMAQMRLYADAMQRFAGARSLHAEDLFNEPRPSIAAAAAHLGIEMPERDLDAVVTGPLFSTYSKSPAEAFDNARRLEVQAQTARLLGSEIDKARRWVEGRLAHCPLPPALDRALVGTSPSLLDG